MSIFRAIIGGAAAGFILHYLVDDFKVNGVGLFDLGLSEKFSSVWFWILSGAALVLALEAIRWAWRKDQADALEQWARLRQYEYREHRRSAKITALAGFRKSIEERNQIVGVVDGVPFEMVDVTTRELDTENNETQKRHTIAMLNTNQSGLTGFILQPRRLNTRIMEWLGMRGAQISYEQLAPYEAAMVAKFNRKYALQTPRLQNTASRDGMHQFIESLQGTLTLPVVEYLLDIPGWCVQLSGEHLAIWQPGRIIPVSRRERVLKTIQELNQRLLADSGSQTDTGITFSQTAEDPQTVGRRMIGAATGALAGFFVGGIVGMYAFFSLSEISPSVPILFSFASFFAPILGCSGLGALLGAKIAGKS